MEHSIDTGPNSPEQYHLSIGGRQDKCIAFFPTHSSPLFIPLLLPCLLFILMWSGWSSWWWHGVDYAVPTVTYSKAAEEGAIVASDLWMTALPVAPAPHWRAHGERGAGRACRDASNMPGLDRYEGRNQYQDIWYESADYEYFCASMKYYNLSDYLLHFIIVSMGTPQKQPQGELAAESQANQIILGWAAFDKNISHTVTQTILYSTFTRVESEVVSSFFSMNSINYSCDLKTIINIS